MGSRLLVVDDNKELLFTISMLLDAFNYEIDTAESGFKATEVLATTTEDFDAVLLDYSMPGMTGLDLIRHIRTRDAWSKIPVIVMTASEHHGQQCLLEGAVAFLRKPYQITELVEHLREACNAVRQ